LEALRRNLDIAEEADLGNFVKAQFLTDAVAFLDLKDLARAANAQALSVEVDGTGLIARALEKAEFGGGRLGGGNVIGEKQELAASVSGVAEASAFLRQADGCQGAAVAFGGIDERRGQ